jgi:hypothetical protein
VERNVRLLLSQSENRIRIQIRIHYSEVWIRGLGSAPKFHGSATLLDTIPLIPGSTALVAPQTISLPLFLSGINKISLCCYFLTSTGTEIPKALWRISLNIYLGLVVFWRQ